MRTGTMLFAQLKGSFKSDVIDPVANLGSNLIAQEVVSTLEKHGMLDLEHKPEPRKVKPAESLKKGGGAKIHKPPVKEPTGNQGKPPEVSVASSQAEILANIEQLNQAIDARTDLSDAGKLAKKQQLVEGLHKFDALSETQKQHEIALGESSNIFASLFNERTADASVGTMAMAGGGFDLVSVSLTALMRGAMTSAGALSGVAVVGSAIYFAGANAGNVHNIGGIKLQMDMPDEYYDSDLAYTPPAAPSTNTITPTVKPEVKPAPAVARTTSPAVKPVSPSASPVASITISNTPQPAHPSGYIPMDYAGYKIPLDDTISINVVPVARAESSPTAQAFAGDPLAELTNSLAKKAHKEDNKPKARVASGAATSSSPDPDDDPICPEDHEDWKVEKYDKVLLYGKQGKFYRDPTAISENGKRLWWSKDTAKHGGSYWKLYEETKDGLVKYKNVDRCGNYMKRNLGEKNKLISWKDLSGVHKK